MPTSISTPPEEFIPTEIQIAIPSETATSTAKATQGTITIWHSWNENQMPVMVQIQHEFRLKYPEYHFDVLYIPINDLLQRYETEVRRGAGPTILIGPAQWGPTLFEAGLITDLSTLGAEEIAATLSEPAVGAARYRGELIGLPYTMSGVVLYRNRLIHPTRAETFDEFISESQFATQGELVGAILERSFYYAGGHLEGIGGRLMDEKAMPAFNDEKGVEWLNLLEEFELSGPPNYFNNQDLELFKEGRVGWIIDGTWNMQEYVEVLGADTLAIDPWPVYGDGSLAGYVHADNIYLSSQAKGIHLDASLEFIKHFLSPDAQAQLTDIGLIPTSTDVQIVDVTSGHLFNQAISALAGGTTYPTLREMEVYSTQMEIALKSFYEGVPAKDVLKAAEDSIRLHLLQLQSTTTPTVTPSP